MDRVMILHEMVDTDDPQGRTIKEVNLDKTHNVPIGSLVEFEDGCRFWVVHHSRDCDGTPLYCLSWDRNDLTVEKKGFANRRWVNGYSEQSLEVIKWASEVD